MREDVVLSEPTARDVYELIAAMGIDYAASAVGVSRTDLARAACMLPVAESVAEQCERIRASGSIGPDVRRALLEWVIAVRVGTVARELGWSESIVEKILTGRIVFTAAHALAIVDAVRAWQQCAK